MIGIARQIGVADNVVALVMMARMTTRLPSSAADLFDALVYSLIGASRRYSSSSRTVSSIAGFLTSIRCVYHITVNQNHPIFEKFFAKRTKSKFRVRLVPLLYRGLRGSTRLPASFQSKIRSKAKIEGQTLSKCEKYIPADSTATQQPKRAPAVCVSRTLVSYTSGTYPHRPEFLAGDSLSERR